MKVIVKLFNKYVLTYKLIADTDPALAKQAIKYKDVEPVTAQNRTVTHDQTTQAIQTLDKLITPVLDLLDMGSLSELIGEKLYSDSLVSTLVDLLVGLLANMDADTWKTIDMVLGLVKDIVGMDIDISVQTYSQKAALAPYFAGVTVDEDTTWADVAAQYIKYAYTYTEGEGDDAKKVEIYLDTTGLTTTTIGEGDDAKTVDVTPVYEQVQKTTGEGDETKYYYTYTVGEGDEAVTTEISLDKAGETTYTVGEGEDAKTYELKAVMVDTDKQATKVDSSKDVQWFADNMTNAQKKAQFIQIVLDLLAPANDLIKLILAGGVYEYDANPDALKYGDSISAFKEINIMGGSGYNYAIIPLFEALGIDPITQAEYNTKVENEPALKYILETVLGILDDTNLENPISFILGIVANLAYTISKNGATTIVSNLIAPVSEIIKTIEDILPIAIKVDLKALIDNSGDVANFWLGSDVKKNRADVGLTIDLDAMTLEDIIASLITKLAPGLNLDFRFKKLAEQSAKTDPATGAILYKDSKVDPKWDISIGTLGRNIEGDPADTLIAITEMILTTDNINAILDMVGFDLGTLPEALQPIINKAIDNPSILVDTIIKILTGDYGFTPETMVYKFLGVLEYNYNSAHGLEPKKNNVKSAINKLDKILLRAVPQVIELLAGMDEPMELITKIYEGTNHNATLENIVNYLLDDLAFSDKTVNTIMSLLVNLLGGMDADTLATVNKIVKQILRIDITPAGVADVAGGKVATFIGEAETWADLAETYKAYGFTYTEGEGDDAKEVEIFLPDADATTTEVDGKTYDLTKLFEQVQKTTGEGDETKYYYTYTVGEGDEAVKTEVALSKAGETKYTVGEGDEAVTYDLTPVMVNGENRVTKAVVSYDWGVDAASNKKDAFLDIVYEITAVAEPILGWLLNGEGIKILIDELVLNGGEGYDNALVPLFKALNIDLPAATASDDGNDLLKNIVDGIFGLVEDIESAPLSTILEIVAQASFFIANNGVALVINNLLAPVLGIVNALSAVVSRGELNDLIASYVKIGGKSYGLDDIINIAGADGSGLVALINDLLRGLKLEDKDGNEIAVTTELPSDFFKQIAMYGIDVTTPANPAVGEEVTAWTVDKTDTLMYILQTVFSADFLDLIKKLAKIDADSDVGQIVTGLAGKQNEVVDIIVMLLNDYTIDYSKISQAAITKIAVAPKSSKITKENIADALTELDSLIPIILGMVTGNGDLESMVMGLLKNLDIGNLLMNLLVPVLAGIESGSIDINTILGYVKQFTNIDLKLDPQTFANNDNNFGSELKNFIGSATKWQQIADRYKKYVYTYTDDKGNEAKYYSTSASDTAYTTGEGDDAKTYPLSLLTYYTYTVGTGDDAKKVDYYGPAGQTTLTIEEGENAGTYTLTPMYHYTYTVGEGADAKTVDYYGANGETSITIGTGEDAKTYTLTLAEANQVSKTEMHINAADFDWKLNDFDAVIGFASDLLLPLDIIFKVLLQEGQIIVLEDTSADRADIRVFGGNGYNYAIIPLLEAFGIAPKTYTEYKAEVTASGSSVNYILTEIIGVVKEILAAPLNTLLEKLANIFYFIGSNGINTVAENLLAPLNKIAVEIDDVYPLAITIDLDNLGSETAQIVSTYLGKAHPGVPAGISIDVSPNKLVELVNNLIGSLNINGTEVSLSLNIDWNRVAAMMAKTKNAAEQNTNGAELKKIATKQSYTEAEQAVEGFKAYENIIGDPTDTFITLLDVLLTQDNTAEIRKLILALLPNTLDEEIKSVIQSVLDNPDAINNLIEAVILLLTGSYTVEEFTYLFKCLATGVTSITDLDDAIKSLDKVIKKAVPAVIDIIAAGENPPEIITELANAHKTDLADIIDYLLNSKLFTQDMMNTLTSAIIPAVSGILSADLTKALNDLLGINLAPQAFAAATGNADVAAYIGTAETWADVKAAHVRELGEDEEGKMQYEVDPIFTNVNDKASFINPLLDLLKPLDAVLSFVLTGQNLTISADGTEVTELNAGYAYERALLPILLKGLGLEDLGATPKTAANGGEALKNVLDYVLDTLLTALADKPFQVILTVVGNLAYFIANDAVAPAIQNLIAPVLGILDVVSDVISRDQINSLLKGLIKINGKGYGLDDLINIAGNNGKVLVDLINSFLGKISVKDQATGEEVATVNALKDTFFLDLAKAAVIYDDTSAAVDDTVLEIPSGTAPNTVWTDAKTWKVANGNALRFVLETLLTEDFLGILADMLKIEPKNENGEDNMVYNIIMSLAGKTDGVIDVLKKLLNKYLVEYKAYKETEPFNKISSGLDSEGKRDQLNNLLSKIDALIPAIFSLIPSIEASSLKELVYGLIANADLGSTLINLIVPLLAKLPADTINTILGYVHSLTNLTDLDIAPQAFAAGTFGSELKTLIGTASTWQQVADSHKKWVYTYTADGETKDFYGPAANMTSVTIDETTYTLTAKLDEETNEQITTFHLNPGEFNWKINNLKDLGKLICDMLQPLDAVLALILRGGTERAAFEADGTHNGAKITAFEDINILGGDGYNYAIIPLLEALGIEAQTQAQYEEAVESCGSSLKPILDALFTKVDAILDKPIDSLLSILANLFYLIGEDNLEIVIMNLIAPVNNLIEAVDKLIPIAIQVNLGEMLSGGEGVKTYIAEDHPGVPAGISIALKAQDLNDLLTNLLTNLEVNGKKLGLSIDFDWLTMAATAAADANNDGKCDKVESKLDTKYDKYVGDRFTDGYMNVVGDKADTLIALLDAILTEENVKAVLDALGIELEEPWKSIVDDIIEDPTKIIDLIIGLFGDPVNIPIQNHVLEGTLGFDYRPYFTLTKANADVIAKDVDALINRILAMAKVGSLKDLVYKKLATNDLINTLLDKLVGVIGTDQINGILETVKNLGEPAEGSNEPNRLDLTVAHFHEVYQRVGLTAGERALRGKTSWAQVPSFAGTNWGFQDGDLKNFLATLAKILTPANGILELLLAGEGKTLNLLGIVDIKGSNGYDYAIIPLLEALGLSSGNVKNMAAYKSAYAADETQLLGYILERIGYQVDYILGKPVDRLTEILPTFAYFVSNEGFYLAVRNLLSPVYTVVNTVMTLFNINLEEKLNLSKLLNSFEIGINVLGKKYGFHIPEIDWTKLAKEGADGTKEVTTSRSQAANSFSTAMRKSELPSYIKNYPVGYEGRAQKTTQTKIIADKGDTLTAVLTWLLKMFGEQGNREALAKWLSDVFDLVEGGGARQAVGYGVNEMFNACDANHVAEIIISSLFSLLGIGVVIDATFNGDVNTVKAILQRIFHALAEGPDTCIYSGIADAMESITGVWKETVGTDEDYHEAVDQAQQTVDNTKKSLNWFQRLIQAIKNFFAKLFRFGR